MGKLRHSDQLIINDLIDHQIFTSTVTGQTTQKKVDAINTLKRPGTQQRISNFVMDLIGQRPESYQDNLTLFVGTQHLPAETVVRQVHSEVTECDDRLILRQINALFVDQLGLLTLDEPATPPRDQVGEIQDYWDVSPDFTFVTQCLVDQLMGAGTQPKLTAIQQLNLQLLTQRYLSRKKAAALWQTLQDNQTAIAEQWAQLDRFYLEVGDDYALLLDKQRIPSEAKPFVIAIVVAHALGVGVVQDELTTVIRQTMVGMPAAKNVTTTQVKQALSDYDLIDQSDGFVSPTALVSRFHVETEEEIDND